MRTNPSNRIATEGELPLRRPLRRSQTGWEADYEGRPPIHPVACMGKIVTDERLDDGRYNLQLRGLCRVRIDAEIENAKLYRSARVEVPKGLNIVSFEVTVTTRVVGVTAGVLFSARKQANF